MTHHPPEETRKQRVNRELVELLNEIRVALPGVEVLFAFLITVPFTQRFVDLSELQQRIYFGTFLCTALATALLIAPTAYHRLQWRRNDKEQLLFVSNRLVIAGLIVLAVAVSGIVFLVTDLVLPGGRAPWVSGSVALVFAALWFVLPLLRRRNGLRAETPVTGPPLDRRSAPRSQPSAGAMH